MVSALLASHAAASGIYVYTGPDGVRSYSDRREHAGFELLHEADATPAASVPAVSRQRFERAYAPLVISAARAHGVEPELLLALVRVESAFNPSARSPKGAIGLGQLMPDTARRFGVQNMWDPAENLAGSALYLRYLLDLFSGDKELALASYNAGEKAVQRYGRIPPYSETRRYVPAVLADYRQRLRSRVVGS